MPAAIPVVVAIAAGAGAMAVGVTLGTAIMIGAMVATVAATMSRETPGMEKRPNVPTSYQSDPTSLTFSTDAPRRLVYGRPRVSGVVVYANVAGEDNEILIMLVAIAAHEISGVDAVYIDGESGAVYGDKLRIRYHLGKDNQAADAELVSLIPQWTAKHRLRGIAYAVVEMHADKEKWKNGVPRNIQFDVRGKPVYDPRTAVTTWSTNPAINLLDYMKSVDGLACKDEDLDMPYWVEAADISDQSPTVFRSSLCEFRYNSSGVIELTSRKQDIIEMFTTSMAGTLVWTSGKFQLFAGSPRPSVGEITENQLIGTPSFTPQSSTDSSFNTVKGTFLDAFNGWTFSDFPAVTGKAYLDEDGEPLIRDINLPLTTSAVCAQRLSTIFLRRERLEEVLVLPCDWSVYNYAVMDVIELTMPTLGWSKRQFQITNWEFRIPTKKDPGGVNLTMREYSDDIYSDNMDILPEQGGGVINVPDTTVVKPPTNFTLQSDIHTVDPATMRPRILAAWTQHPNPYVSGYEIYIRENKAVEEPWEPLPNVTTVSKYFKAEAGITYDVGIRAVSVYGTKSPTIVQTIKCEGTKTILPDNVDMVSYRFTGEPINGEQPYVQLEWSDVSNAESYRIRFVEDGSGVATDVAVVPTPTTTFMRRRFRVEGKFQVYAVNSLGNLSAKPAEVLVPGATNSIDIVTQGYTPYDYDLSGMVQYLNLQLVPDSKSLASALGWEVFDEIVPDPVDQCTIWSKSYGWVNSGTVTPGGLLAYTNFNESSSGTYQLKPMGYNDTLKESFTSNVEISNPGGSNLKSGVTFETSDILCVITSANTYVEKL